MAETRRHHFVPQFFLGGFTIAGGKEGKLFVIDFETRKQWPARPKDVANERDFYRVEIAGEKPTIIEDAFAQGIESATAPIVDVINSRRALPKGEDLSTLLRFITLLALRGPLWRKTMIKGLNDLSHGIWSAVLSSREAFEAAVRKIPDGETLLKGTTYEEMKSFIQDTSFDSDTPENRNWYVGQTIKLVDTAFPFFADRTWSLLVAPEDAPDFVCTDNPVALSSTIHRPPMFPPGFASMDSVITVPLGRRILMRGIFGGRSAAISVDARTVAGLNSLAIMQGVRFTYSSSGEIRWLNTDKVEGTAELLKKLEEVRLKQAEAKK
jgi:hypothetical protein